MLTLWNINDDDDNIVVVIRCCPCWAFTVICLVFVCWALAIGCRSLSSLRVVIESLGGGRRFGWLGLFVVVWLA